MSAFDVSLSGPFSSLGSTLGGSFSPSSPENSRKLVCATCLTWSANVRTPLNSPWVGAKLNLSSGIASAAGTNSFSSVVSWRSRICATVSFGGG
jgi:hypothetical protein